MHGLTVTNTPAPFLGIAEAATERLRGSPYQALRSISCESKYGVLFLRGRLGSYFQKQLAQEAVAGVSGVTEVVNEIEVDQLESDRADRGKAI